MAEVSRDFIWLRSEVTARSETTVGEQIKDHLADSSLISKEDFKRDSADE